MQLTPPTRPSSRAPARCAPPCPRPPAPPPPRLPPGTGGTIRRWPMLNATYDDAANVITRHGALHLGMATQTPNGLMVPVIRNAHAMSVWQLASEALRLAEAARSGQGAREELSGSPITLRP